MAGDLSNSAHTITWHGDVQTQGEEIILNGTDAWGEIADNVDFNFGSGDWTIEIFGAKLDDVGVITHMLTQYDSGTDQRSWSCAYRGDLSPKKMDLVLAALGAGPATTIQHDLALSAGVAADLCWERSGNTIRMYSDGAFLGKTTHSDALHDSTSPVAIGALLSSGSPGAFSTAWAGRFKAIRITKGKARFASDGGYTVPTLPLPTTA